MAKTIEEYSREDVELTNKCWEYAKSHPGITVTDLVLYLLIEDTHE